MTSPSIPESVRRLVSESIRSLEQLEAILFLTRHPDHYFRTETSGAEIGAKPAALAPQLEQLASVGFLDVKIANDVLYRFSPAQEKAAKLAADLVDTYQVSRLALIHLICE